MMYSFYGVNFSRNINEIYQRHCKLGKLIISTILKRIAHAKYTDTRTADSNQYVGVYTDEKCTTLLYAFVRIGLFFFCIWK